ncbi:magnesium transporter CorA family protein [Rhodoferax sp.]|uniref:magnesium transporter CorA family protein n=1 Tax=Rhodoferax sp. TaxID=50421 RepID=UPI0025F68164|nr:magnesium transporter CorA family protein [Rhodoferax sp.]
MRIFTIVGTSVVEATALPTTPVPGGFVWMACARGEFETQLAQIQATLQQLCGHTLVDLHVSDLLNKQLPSHYDYTSQYDLLVFRRLAAGHPEAESGPAAKHSGPPILRRIDTSPVGFAVFDQVLLTVHPSDCAVRDSYADKLLAATSTELRASGARVPTSPADVMLRIVNLMVDGYLDLRRELTRQLDHWQTALLQPGARFSNWGALLDARLTLHQLDDVCEEQRSAIQDWIEAVKTWPDTNSPAAARERELLQVRSRDVLEHIERVVHHVRRLEQSVETAVQMHFSVQGNRANDIMLTLTVLTAIFLPLNLIAGIFGMNFEVIPLLHRQGGFWWAMGAMAVIAVGMGLLFWRKRYLKRSGS